MSLRTEKLSSVIKRVLSPVVSRIAQENKLGLSSVSKVTLSKDFSVANVFVNIFAEKDGVVEQLLKVLNSNKGLLRSVVAREVRMRKTPDIRFYYNDILEEMERVDKLLSRVNKESPYKEDYGDESVYNLKEGE